MGKKNFDPQPCDKQLVGNKQKRRDLIHLQSQIFPEASMQIGRERLSLSLRKREQKVSLHKEIERSSLRNQGKERKRFSQKTRREIVSVKETKPSDCDERSNQ